MLQDLAPSLGLLSAGEWSEERTVHFNQKLTLALDFDLVTKLARLAVDFKVVVEEFFVRSTVKDTV